MANSTDTFWDINGVSLQTYAKNITTWGGDLQAPPPLRGEDLTIPYRPGKVFQMRRPDARTITFTMWVVGATDDGAVPTDRTMRSYFEQHLKNLRALFWNQGQQFNLTRRWRDPNGTLRTATAKAVFAGGFVPAMTGSLRATFTVDVYLSDPFFYGPEEEISFPASASSSVSANIKGDYETTAIILDLNGSRNNIRVTNSTESIYVNVAQNLSTGQLVRVDVDNWTAVKSPGSSEVNVIGSVTSLGHEFWFALRPGTQNLVLSSSTGTAGATLKYRPRYI